MIDSEVPDELLPDVHFGEVADSADEDVPEAPDEETDDDEELAETPPDVTALLGFDPLELDDESGDTQTQPSE